MSLPLRMNLVDVVIKQLDVSSTYKDSDFREGRAVVRYSDPVTLRGQPNLGDVKFHMNVRDPSSTGDQDRTTGHIVFRLSYPTSAYTLSMALSTFFRYLSNSLLISLGCPVIAI